MLAMGKTVSDDVHNELMMAFSYLLARVKHQAHHQVLLGALAAYTGVELPDVPNRYPAPILDDIVPVHPASAAGDHISPENFERLESLAQEIGVEFYTRYGFRAVLNHALAIGLDAAGAKAAEPTTEELF